MSYNICMNYPMRVAAGLICATAVSVLCISCTEKNTAPGLQPDSKKSTVLILAGEDFKRESGAFDLIAMEYGLAEEKGRVRILYWPETFDTANSSLRLFTETAEEEKPGIIVTLGAPEGTLRELRRINGILPAAKIISIFPLEEPIPVEAVSGLLVDVYVPGLESDTAAPQDENDTAVEISGKETALILLGAVLAMETDDGDSIKSETLAAGIAEAAEKTDSETKTQIKDWEYMPAVDTETGIRSKKHVLVKTN